IEAGCEVMVHDPHVLEYPGVSIIHELDDVVKGADVVAVLTGHDEYFRVDAERLKGLMGVECPVIVDGRNVVDADGFIGAGFVYKRIGRGNKNGHIVK
ncbi:MAG TPA: nucleotide sugar dehydrogenase, partial [Methanosarcinaceae archaeon]|nr:nucleotide sugar dehydrogenase [Methanosarcinaceae archaeon]